jgi:hypothetical protein
VKVIPDGLARRILHELIGEFAGSEKQIVSPLLEFMRDSIPFVN